MCIDADMSNDSSRLFWAGLVAVTLVTTGAHLRADVKTPATPGMKTVQIAGAGGKKVAIQVQDSADPFKSVSSDATGPYDPEHIFSRSSTMADKSFMGSTAQTKTNSEFTNSNSFPTKAYDDPAVKPGQASKFDTHAFPVTSAATTSAATGFDKPYLTASATNKSSAYATATDTDDQNHAANLGKAGKPETESAYVDATKQYLGPGAQHVPDGVNVKENVVLSRVSDIPNRPLSIDEVRNLINHETKPNTDEPSEPASKPLNDPTYQPEPLRDNPHPGNAKVDDDKDDPVPSPGTIADPESAEPLPQH
jgi:hypothetical protein